MTPQSKALDRASALIAAAVSALRQHHADGDVASIIASLATQFANDEAAYSAGSRDHSMRSVTALTTSSAASISCGSLR